MKGAAHLWTVRYRLCGHQRPMPTSHPFDALVDADAWCPTCAAAQTAKPKEPKRSGLQLHQQTRLTAVIEELELYASATASAVRNDRDRADLLNWLGQIDSCIDRVKRIRQEVFA